MVQLQTRKYTRKSGAFNDSDEFYIPGTAPAPVLLQPKADSCSRVEKTRRLSDLQVLERCPRMGRFEVPEIGFSLAKDGARRILVRQVRF